MQPSEPVDATAFILCRPYLPLDDHAERRFEASLREFSSVSWLNVPDRGGFRPDIIRSSPASEEASDVPPALLALAWRADALLRFTISVPPIEGYGANAPEDWTAETLYDSNTLDICEELCRRISDAFFGMNIARPGCIQLVGATVRAGRRERTCPTQYPQEWRDLMQDVDRWPLIRDLEFARVWQWLEVVPGFSDGFSSDPVGRAVQALSYLLGDSDNPVALLWTMIGLEALFTSGEAGMAAQMRERSAALLGHHPSADKRVKGMYSVRSKFVHGKIDIPGATHIYDASDDFLRLHSELSRAIETGHGMLLAAIQELIVRDWHPVAFHTAVTGE